MHDVTQNLFLSLCPSLDGGNGGEEPAVWRLHPLPSEVPQVNPDVEMFHTPNAALVCTNCLNYARTHTLHIHCCALSNHFNGQDGERKVHEGGRGWGLRRSWTFKGRHRAGFSFEAGLTLGPTSLFSYFCSQNYSQPISKNSQWLLSGSRHAYWI